MAPQESNEEAMRRLIAKGKGRDSHQRHGNAGKGKGGKGVKGGCPPSSDEIPEARREELCAELEEFVASESKQLQMPTSITGLERKFLHEQAELRSLTTQSFGQGRERYLCIFKQEQAVIEEAAPASAAVGKVSYSAVFLDEESRKKLFDFCGRTIAGGIPARWKMYGDHMTICLGPLSDPTTEDFRSVAETVQKQIRRYQEQQRFELQVVSLGHNDDAIAVGVIGCTSCNRNPHITVATAPQIPPNASNMIKKWTMLPSTEQLTLVGHLKQLGAGDARAPRAAPAAAAGAPEVEPAAEVEAEVTEESFASHSWHGRRFKLGCVDGSDAVDWFGVGPPPGYSTRGDLLDREDVPDSQALMLGFSKEEAPTFIFEELGQTKGGDVVNPLTLPGGVTVPQAYVYTFRLAEGPPCYVSEHDEGPGPEYFVADLAPSHSHFAFLPLEGNTRSPKTKVSGAEKDEKDCCYGMYHMEKKQGQDYYTYWMDGDYPVYIITDQLCRASDECYPPTRYKVCWDPEFVLRVIEVDIESDEGTSAWRLVARSLAGDVVAELKVRRKTKLGELRAQLREAMPASSVHATISLVNAKSKSLLQPSDDSKAILSLM